jgi:hypothetical protein
LIISRLSATTPPTRGNPLTAWIISWIARSRPGAIAGQASATSDRLRSSIP